ncbi:hypothetical protein B0H34DRAFT_385868 [Crassisporium funariophilum]|nr:hypothetical protein B0H34DRAFT_385868 [Crassisporium funariophilum]
MPKLTTKVLLYAQEVAFIAMTLGVLAARNRFSIRRMKRHWVQTSTNPDFHDFIESYMPLILKHIERLYPRYLELSTWYEKKKEDIRMSPSIFNPAPFEAVWLAMVEMRQLGSLLPDHVRSYKYAGVMKQGRIRIEYYTTLEKGQHQTPDTWMYLPIVRNQGVDLSVLYKQWGLESVAFVVDNKLRPVFKPAKDRFISLTAVHDISKGFSQPLRVFESRISTMTVVKRTIRKPCYLVLFLMASLYKMAIGYPIETSYMSVLYGSRYALFYQGLSRRSAHLRHSLTMASRIVTHLCYAIIMLFGTLIWHTFVAAKIVTSWPVKKAAAVAAWGITQVGGGINIILSLDKKAWVVVAALSWYTVAEFRTLGF